MADTSKDLSEATASRTLGSTDTFSEENGTVGESTWTVIKDKNKTPWVDLFKPSRDKGGNIHHLNFFAPVNGRAVIEDNELLVPCKWSTQPHDHVLSRFNTEEERCKILSNGDNSLYGKPLFLKTLPEHFHLENNDFSTLPIWVQFPSLPVEFWGPIALSKIASCIDTSFHSLEAIPVSTPSGYSFSQEVYYELEPCFCTKCRSNDHYKEECSGKWKNSRKGRKANSKGKRGGSRRPRVKVGGDATSIRQSNGYPSSSTSVDTPIIPRPPIGLEEPDASVPYQPSPLCGEGELDATPEGTTETDLDTTECVKDGDTETPQAFVLSEPSSPINTSTELNNVASPLGSNTLRGKNVLNDIITKVF
nr:hypothetical protein POPTR_014G189200 [Ipomoea batatas]